MKRPNGFRRALRPTEKSYMEAVREIIMDVQKRFDLSDVELAEILACSDGTIGNARNRKAKLGGVSLAIIEHEFGPGAIDPFMALAGARSTPRCLPGADVIDPKLPLVDALHAIIEAQAPESEGGSEITRAEVHRHLPKLKGARCALDQLIALAETPCVAAAA